MKDEPPGGRAPVALEPARPGDLPAVSALASAALPEAWSEALFAGELARGEGRLWVARERGTRGIAGYVVLRRVEDAAHVLSMAVTPPRRRAGVGRALLGRALAVAAREGARRADLEVRAGNAGAQAFYAAMGFVAAERRPRYYPGGEDALRMARSLEVEGDETELSVPPPGAPLRAEASVVGNRAEGACRRLALRLPAALPESAPGQFAMLSPGARGGAERFDPLLPRPMALYRVRRDADVAEVEVLYKVVGRGTALLADARAGDRLRFVGPLGRGFALPAPGERALLVGGGTGIASLYALAARALAAAPEGAAPLVLLGARSAPELMGRDDFEALGVPVRVATEDGSAGPAALVTELLEAALEEPGSATRVYACGPTPMMRRAAALAAAAGRPCAVSLENRMACGYGVCLGCAVPRAAGGFDLVCREGPVFASGALAWEGVP